MSILKSIKGINDLPYTNLIGILGDHGTGKTTIAGTFPKPMLYVSVDADGGGVVLKEYSSDEVKVINLLPTERDSVYHQYIELLDELYKTNNAGYKTVVTDAHTSLQQDLVTFMRKSKGGKQLNENEWGVVGTAMIDVRDRLIRNAQSDTYYVQIMHSKNERESDDGSGTVINKIIPDMTRNNGNKLLQRMSAVIHTSTRAVKHPDGSNTISFVSYFGGHPNIGTKLRRRDGKPGGEGFYVENCTFDDIDKILGGIDTSKLDKKVEITKTNPFEDVEDVLEGSNDNW